MEKGESGKGSDKDFGKIIKPHNTKDGTVQSDGSIQLSLFQLDDPILCQMRDEILNLDVNNLTPLEALNKLNDIKKILKGK